MPYKILTLITFITLSFTSISQITDTISVGFTKSAYLIFPDSSFTYDIGSEDILIRRAGKKIIVQAALEGFEETNLLVEHKNQMFMYLIKYTANPKKFLYDYSKNNVVVSKPIVQQQVQSTVSNPTNNLSNSTTTSNNSTKSKQAEEITNVIEEVSAKDSILNVYKSNCAKILKMDNRIFNRGIIDYKVHFFLRDIVISDEKIYLKFSIENKGNIPYTIDYDQFKVQSIKKKVKGESFQVIELTPLLEYNRPKVIQGKSSHLYVIVLDKFVLTETKKLVIEQWENNGKDMNIEGGRKLSFDITSQDILNVTQL